jgi:hypothetical protein
MVSEEVVQVRRPCVTVDGGAGLPSLRSGETSANLSNATSGQKELASTSYPHPGNQVMEIFVLIR